MNEKLNLMFYLVFFLSLSLYYIICGMHKNENKIWIIFFYDICELWFE